MSWDWRKEYERRHGPLPFYGATAREAGDEQWPDGAEDAVIGLVGREDSRAGMKRGWWERLAADDAAAAAAEAERAAVVRFLRARRDEVLADDDGDLAGLLAVELEDIARSIAAGEHRGDAESASVPAGPASVPASAAPTDPAEGAMGPPVKPEDDEGGGSVGGGAVGRGAASAVAAPESAAVAPESAGAASESAPPESVPSGGRAPATDDPDERVEIAPGRFVNLRSARKLGLIARDTP